MQQRLASWEWGALGAAICVRVAALLSFEQTTYARVPLVDALTYWQQAQSLFKGLDPFEKDGLYQPPAYPYLLGLLGHLTGGPDLSVARWVQAGLGALTALLLLLLGRDLGRRVGAPWAGAAAALLYSLYPTTLLFEQDILTPALTNAALVGALAAAWWGRRAWSGALSGLLAGLAAAAHPTYLLAAGALGLHLALRSRLAGALFALGVILCLAPTTARNYRDFDRFALVSFNSGVNFYLGNNPRWRETAFLRPGLPFRELILEAEPDKRNVAERSDYWRQRAWSEIAAAPDAWAAALATKAYWSVHNTEVPRNEDYRCRLEEPALRWVGFLPVRYGWVFPFALAGAALLARRGREERLIVGLWAATHLPLALFLVADRYRLATWPLVSLCAPVGAAALLRALAGWRAGTRPHPAWLALLPAAILPWLPTDPVIRKDEGWCRHVQGHLALAEKDPERALALYQEAAQLDPDNVSSLVAIAELHEAGGRYAEAAAALERVLAELPTSFPTLKDMAKFQYKLGNTSEAADYLGRAYRVPGDRTATGVQYVKVLAQAGRREEARAVVAADPALRGHPDVPAELKP